MSDGWTKEAKVGEVYNGKVTRIMNFGAFCEILPGKEGLVHVSELSDKYVDNIEEVVKVGDEIMVKVIEIDMQGRINLSKKQSTTDGPPVVSRRGENSKNSGKKKSWN